MFIRVTTHQRIVREKDQEIRRLLELVESQSERLLVIAGYRPLMPQQGPVQTHRGRQLTEEERELEARLADAREL